MKPCGGTRRTRDRGSTLVVTLIITLLLGCTLASYLMLVGSEHASTVRSQAWNRALVLAEAGVEEALTQLNPGAFTTNVAGGNGWTLSDGFFQPDPPERTLLGGRYAVVYTPANPPTIYSTGYTTLPPESLLLSRVVRVTTTNAPLFSAGLSIGKITNPSQHSYYLDSYDSGNSTYSDGGHYSPAKAKTAATANAPSTTRTEYPDVLPPFEVGLSLPTKIGNIYNLSGNNNYFVVGDMTLPNSDKIYVGDNSTATIYVTGNLSMSTEAEIEIAPTGILRIYVAGKTTTLDYINNHGTPHNFQYYGLPANTNVTLAQTTPEVAASIYAPQATFVASGGSSAFDYSGVLIVNNLVLNRTLKFHFDESLARSGPRRGFLVSSWSEL